MAIAFGSITTAATTSSGTLSLAKPSGTADGDLLIYSILEWYSVAQTPLSGFTQFRANGARGTGGLTQNIRSFYRYASSEPANYNHTAGSNGWYQVTMMRVTGAVLSGNPEDVGTVAQSSSAGTTAVGGNLSPTTNGLLVFLVHATVGSPSFTPPSGMTERADFNQAFGGVEVATLVVAPGATGQKDATIDRSSDWQTQLFVLKELAAPADGWGMIPIN